jgi:hypothetical protein
MGLVFRENTVGKPIIIKTNTNKLTSSNIKFLRSLGFKVNDVGH